MLLPDAKMQISFMKDLATLRSPQSPITFLSYLHSQDRLINFINRGSTIPTRKEYADYLSWAAQWVQDHGIPVSFATEVVAIDTDADGIVIVRSKNLTTGEITSRRTRMLPSTVHLFRLLKMPPQGTSSSPLAVLDASPTRCLQLSTTH